MSQKVTIELTDDYEAFGEPSKEVKATETLEFNFDGQWYEIDLSEKNATNLRESVMEFADCARKTRGPGADKVKRSSGKATVRSDREQNQRIREWAQGEGIPISGRGRIPAEVLEQYHAQSKPAVSSVA